MSFNLKVPTSAVKYVLFQRTEYLVVQNSKLLNKLLIRIPFLFYNDYVLIEAFLFSSRVKRLYGEDISREYERIKNYLPDKASSILDVGCGVAGIDVFLNNHYKNNPPDIYLLDKTEIEGKVFYGLKDRASFYNSLPIAKQLLIDNGVSENRIHTQEVGDDNKIKFGKKFDLVISLISWGFHYPVSVYLDQVYEMLNPGGTLIIDVRNVAGAEDLLKNKFGSSGTVIYERKKEKRFVFKKA